MKNINLLIFVLLICLPTIICGQTASKKNAISWRWAWTNFQYPISNDWNSIDYTTGGELAYSRYLNRWFNLSTPLKLGKADFPTDDLGNFKANQVMVSLDALAHFKFVNENSRFQPYLLAGPGIMLESTSDTKLNAEVPLGFGLNIEVMDGLFFSLENQYRLDFSDNRNQLQHTAGIKFEFGDKQDKVSDRDKDGVPDEEDDCPDKAGDRLLAGCPDSDGDGVSDKDDDCPFEKGAEALNGCPDSDGDGVADYMDECPDLVGSTEAKGCPTTDTDGDSVPDYKDKCPDHSGPIESDGCPDSDGDGVPDPFDRCPDKAGTEANLGCPELIEEEKDVLEFAMKAVQFETGSAKLIGESNTILKQIAEIMSKYPEQKLRISGHTDSIGTPEENQTLSESRAKMCYDTLIKFGIPASKMTYIGFGETKPIESNMFAPGREKNRRVEFEVYVE